MASDSVFPWGTRTFVMGVLNTSPDSFSGDGLREVSAVVARARAMVADGADILDVGGESTRPGYQPVPAEEEIARVVPAVRALTAAGTLPISIDTSKSRVAGEAIAAGASIVNDVSGLADGDMTGVVAETGAGLVIVHAWSIDPRSDLVRDLTSRLADLVEMAVRAGVNASRIMVDPGFGFGKGWKENFEILRRLGEMRALGLPVLVGLSRKGSIGRVLGVEVHDRIEGTIALDTIAIVCGVDMVRVHDVRPSVRATRMTDALVRG